VAKQVFKSKRVAGITKVNTGTGSYTVAIPFTPNFIDISFYDQQHKHAADVATFDLATVAGGYTLTVHYTVHEAREIRHVVAVLPVDPEQTIAH
jgi:hypothetical protein